MLGRLEMDVETCIEFYSTLIKTVFEQKSSWWRISLSGNIRAQYSSKVLEDAIKTVLSACSVSEDEPFHDPSKNLRCRVFVISKISNTIPMLIGQQLRMRKIERNLRNHYYKELYYAFSAWH